MQAAQSARGPERSEVLVRHRLAGSKSGLVLYLLAKHPGNYMEFISTLHLMVWLRFLLARSRRKKP